MKKSIYSFLFVTLGLLACNQKDQTPYDHPFVHIMYMANGLESSAVEISDQASFTATYFVYLSSKPLTQDLLVSYEIVPGDGLVENRDYRMLSTARSLTFAPGIYEMPIRIMWLPRTVDPTKDNTLRIRILSTSPSITVGLPGPDQLQSTLVFNKLTK